MGSREGLGNYQNIWNPPPSHQVAFYALWAARPLRFSAFVSGRGNLATVKQPTAAGHRVREGFSPPFLWIWATAYPFARPPTFRPNQ